MERREESASASLPESKPLSGRDTSAYVAVMMLGDSETERKGDGDSS